MAIMSGRARETTTFHGSSEDRADARAAAVARAIAMAAPARVLSCMAEIGGPHISGRGRRYIMVQTPGRTVLDWVHWRRAKRLERQGAIVIRRSLKR